MGDGQQLEETVAHLMRNVEELSAEVARQATELDRLSRHVRLLVEQAVEDDDGIVLTDQRPPHY